MPERRTSGATHSFRLSVHASDIVERLNYPRKLGGKSKRVSDAIVWFWTTPTMSKKPGWASAPTAAVLLEENEELKRRVKFWVAKYDQLKKAQDYAPPPPWWHRFFRRS